MVSGRLDRISRTLSRALAAVAALALPWALHGVPSAHAIEENKAAPAAAPEKSAAEPKQAPKQVSKQESAEKADGDKKPQGATAAHKKHKKKAKKRLAAKEAQGDKPKGHSAPVRKEPQADHEEPNVAVHHETKKTEGKPSGKHDKSSKKPGAKGKSTTSNEHGSITLSKQENVAVSLKTEKTDKSDKSDKSEKPGKVDKHAKPVDPHSEASNKTAKKPETNSHRHKRASTHQPGGKRRSAKKDADADKPPCFAPALSLDRNGIESDQFSLVDCKGNVLESAREKLSVLARPWGSPRPTLPSRKKGEQPDLRLSKDAKGSHGKKDKAHDTLAKSGGEQADLEPGEIAPNVRLLDAGLLARIEAIHKHYPGKSMSLVSGYRPKSKGSLHQSARALDLRVVGVTNEELVAFCKTLEDTGCGYYPNSSFVHVDVRNKGTGSVTWIDASGPGETPRYVTQWPPPPDEKPTEGVVDEEPEKTPTATVAAVAAAKESEPVKEVAATKEASVKEPAKEVAATKEASSKPAVQKEADPKDKDDAGSCVPAKATASQQR